ncbi:MAG: hypothetical protein LH473_11975 [Chitinophagales bacterium]|nr:hypothetical protein [Chitinophagales bacterium]
MENNITQVEDENAIANEFAINTANIYHAERVFGNDPEFRNWKKLTINIIRELETEVQDLLVKFAEPTVKHNEEQLEYLKERNHRFLEGIIKGGSAFYPDYLHIDLKRV